MEIESELLQNLSQVGYMACLRGLTDEGEVIMEGVHAVRPDQTPILVGLAIARLSSSRYDEAIDILQNNVLKEDPKHMTAKCFLGVALVQSGREKEGLEHLKVVLEEGQEDEKVVAGAFFANEEAVAG